MKKRNNTNTHEEKYPTMCQKALDSFNRCQELININDGTTGADDFIQLINIMSNHIKWPSLKHPKLPLNIQGQGELNE